MLEKVCKKPQMLVDVFVNYDCDIEAPNLFERMVTVTIFIVVKSLFLLFFLPPYPKKEVGDMDPNLRSM